MAILGLLAPVIMWAAFLFLGFVAVLMCAIKDLIVGSGDSKWKRP